MRAIGRLWTTASMRPMIKGSPYQRGIYVRHELFTDLGGPPASWRRLQALRTRSTGWSATRAPSTLFMRRIAGLTQAFRLIFRAAGRLACWQGAGVCEGLGLGHGAALKGLQGSMTRSTNWNAIRAGSTPSICHLPGCASRSVEARCRVSRDGSMSKVALSIMQQRSKTRSASVLDPFAR